MTLAHQNAVTYAEIKKPAYPMYTVHYETRQNMNFAGKMPKVVIEQWVCMQFTFVAFSSSNNL